MYQASYNKLIYNDNYIRGSEVRSIIIDRLRTDIKIKGGVPCNGTPPFLCTKTRLSQAKALSLPKDVALGI